MGRTAIRHVAFLGGVNVGGHRVTMERLRDEMAQLGFDDVATFIASGNVLFTAVSSPTHAERIANGLGAAFGWPVPTFVRTAAQVTAATELAPFGPLPDGCTDMICWCATPPDCGVEALSNDVDRFEVHGSELHWRIRGGVSGSSVTMPKLTRALGQPFTSRNVNSLRKLVEILVREMHATVRG